MGFNLGFKGLIVQVLTRDTYNVLVHKNKSKVETVLPVFKACLNAQGISLYIAVSEPHNRARLTADTRAHSDLCCACVTAASIVGR